MKWLLILLTFIGGVSYVIYQNNAEKRKETSEKQTLVDMAARATATTEKPYVIKISGNTLRTLHGLVSDTNADVRFASMELLWQLQDERSPSFAKRMFQEETDTDVKKLLITMLAKEKTKLSLALLAEALSDYEKETRLEAVRAISGFSNKEAILVLNKLLKDEEEDVRLKVLESIDLIKKDLAANKETPFIELERKPRFKIE